MPRPWPNRTLRPPMQTPEGVPHPHMDVCCPIGRTITAILARVHCTSVRSQNGIAGDDSRYHPGTHPRPSAESSLPEGQFGLGGLGELARVDDHIRIGRVGGAQRARIPQDGDQGSIIVVVATDAPLLPHQLDRVVKRVPLGIGLWEAGRTSGTAALTMLPNGSMNPLFNATAQAVEEAIVNALVAADTGDRNQREYGLRAASRPTARGVEKIHRLMQ